MECMTEGREMRLALDGEIDHHRARILMEQLEEKLEEGMPRSVVLDLGAVTFMDSSGIAILMLLYRFCSETDGKLAVVNIPRQPGKVLRAAGLQDRIEMTFI